MRVFISWSGDRSKLVAELLKEWLKTVIQASKPWISTGIDRGALWAGEIGSVLSETNVGILCITAENVNGPWLLFEAGALAKGLQQSRVIPLLIDLTPADLRMPLSQFNATGCDSGGITQLVHTVNLATTDPLETAIVDASIEAHWNRFSVKLAQIIESTNSAVPAVRRTDGDKLDEVLSLVHGLAGRIHQLERSSIDQVTFANIARTMKANGISSSEAAASNLGFPTMHIGKLIRSGELLGGTMAGEHSVGLRPDECL